MRKNEDEKRSVGRPKLADTKLKRESLIVSLFVIMVAIMIALVGGYDLAVTSGHTPSKLSGNVVAEKLQGKAKKKTTTKKKTTAKKKKTTTKKKTTKKKTAAKKKKTTTTKPKSGCVISFTKIKSKNARYELLCAEKSKMKSIEVSNGAKTKLIKGTKKKFKGKITNMKTATAYSLTIVLTNGKTYTKNFNSNSTSDANAVDLSKLEPGTCPAAPMIEGVFNSKTKKYATNKFKITISTEGLTDSEINNLYIVERTYDSKRNIIYKINGKKVKENVGRWNDRTYHKLTSTYMASGKRYYKTIMFNTYHGIIIYSGSNRCYTNYFVENGKTLVNTNRKYRLARYNIVTTKGIARGYGNSNVTISDTKVLRDNGKNVSSCKAFGQDAKSGNENDKKTKVTITLGNITGSFYIKIPGNYMSTGFLQHPLYKNGNNKDTGIKKGYEKAKNTVKSNGKTAYGIELEAKEGSAVYAMGSGKVVKVRKTLSDKDSYGYYVVIQTTINNNLYTFTYAHLKTIGVKAGDRVYKGQQIGTVGKTGKKGSNLKKAMLYVFATVKGSNGKYYGLTINNFIGRNLSYANANITHLLRKYIENGDLTLNNLYCTGKGSKSNISNSNSAAEDQDYDDGEECDEEEDECDPGNNDGDDEDAEDEDDEFAGDDENIGDTADGEEGNYDD